MPNGDENNFNKRDESSTRQNDSIMPESLSNPIYTPGFLRQYIGRLMRIEFLIGTNNMVDRTGFLYEVGASYVLLKSFEGDSLIYADIYAIKFITISNNPTISSPTMNPNMNFNYNGTYMNNRSAY